MFDFFLHCYDSLFVPQHHNISNMWLVCQDSTQRLHSETSPNHYFSTSLNLCDELSSSTEITNKIWVLKISEWKKTLLVSLRWSSFSAEKLQRQRVNMKTEVCGVSGGNCLSSSLTGVSLCLHQLWMRSWNEDKRTDWIYSLFQLSASSHIRF